MADTIVKFRLPIRECCNKCKSLKKLWWFETDGKHFGTCCVMLLGENVVVKIDDPENDMCEMFSELDTEREK